MAKKTFIYAATIRISVKVEDFCGAQIARRIATRTMVDIRDVSRDSLYGTPKVSGGSLRRVMTRKATAS